MRHVVLSLVLVGLLGCTREKSLSMKTADCPTSKASVMTVSDGRLLTDKAGIFEKTCGPSSSFGSKGSGGCVELFFYVVPLVPSGWVDGDAIPAWITCTGKHKSLAGCLGEISAYKGPLGGTVQVREGDSDKLGRAVSGWETAMKDATTRYSIKPSPHAPVLALGRLD